MTASILIYVVKCSEELRQCFADLDSKIKEQHQITLLSSTTAKVDTDDALFVGGEVFVITATSDGRFFTTPALVPPNLLFGAYSTTAKEAVDVAINWLRHPDIKIPTVDHKPIYRR